VFWLDEDRGRLTPAQRHRRLVDTHCNRIAAEQPLMQDLDPGAFDKPQLDQPPLELGSRETVLITLDANRPNPSSRSDCGCTQRHGVLRFTSNNARALSHSLAEAIATLFQLQVSDRMAGIACRRTPGTW